MLPNAAGAVVTVGWASRGSLRLRRGLLALGVVPFLLPNIVLLLPVLPAERLPGFVVDVNYDAGETIGWPAFADSGSTAHERLERSELLVAIGEAMTAVLTPHQRTVFGALALNGVPIDVLAERLGTSRGALYKTLHDARRKLRAELAAAGLAEADDR